MAATPSVRIVKETAYRGGTKQWSNRYHFSGGTPSGSSAWQALIDDIVDAESNYMPTSTTIVEGLGYDAGSDLAAFSKAYTTAGLLALTSKSKTPLECAVLLRYSTTQRTSKNHPVYLFNYFHDALYTTGSSPDSVNSTQKSDLEAYGTLWLAGFPRATPTYVRAGPNGAVAQSRQVDVYITHRDFPR